MWLKSTFSLGLQEYYKLQLNFVPLHKCVYTSAFMKHEWEVSDSGADPGVFGRMGHFVWISFPPRLRDMHNSFSHSDGEHERSGFECPFLFPRLSAVPPSGRASQVIIPRFRVYSLFLGEVWRRGGFAWRVETETVHSRHRPLQNKRLRAVTRAKVLLITWVYSSSWPWKNREVSLEHFNRSYV